MKLTITQGKGFKIEFGSGRKLSVQIGYGNYCQNHDHEGMRNAMMDNRRYEGVVESEDAEIAVMWEHGFLRMPGEYDDVMGWVPMKEVVQWIFLMALGDLQSDDPIHQKLERHIKDQEVVISRCGPGMTAIKARAESARDFFKWLQEELVPERIREHYASDGSRGGVREEEAGGQ